MSEVIMWELQFFLKAFLMGFCLRLIYDSLLIFRKIVRHRHFVISIEDVLYWILCSIYVFGLLYKENDGTPRGFAVFGVLMGMLLYHLGLSKLLVPVVSRGLLFFIRKVRKFLEIIFKRLKKPFLWVTMKLAKKRRKKKEKKALKKAERKERHGKDRTEEES